MRKILFISLITLVFLNNSIGQVINIPIKISDGISGDTLRFGLDPAATNGIDILLNENELPPLPPSGIFDARFTGSGLTPPVPIGNGLKNDYREGSSGYYGEKKHRIKYQTGSGSVILINWWNLPSEISIRIQDVINGSLIDTTITGSGSYRITNPLGFSSMYLTVIYSFITSVSFNTINQDSPFNLTLLQNFPNPFNPVTNIKYYLPVEGNVKLSVYNSSGHLVKILIDSYIPAGFHEQNFNASDLPSGVYYYKIQAAKFSDSKRMLLLK